MKEFVEKIGVENETTHEGFNLGSMVMVVLLFLIFLGTSFYLMLTNY